MSPRVRADPAASQVPAVELFVLSSHTENLSSMHISCLIPFRLLYRGSESSSCCQEDGSEVTTPKDQKACRSGTADEGQPPQAARSQENKNWGQGFE